MRLSPKQQDWLEAANPEEFQAWMVKGEPDAVEMISRKDHTTYWGPTLRGVRITGSYGTYEEARKVAEDLKAEWLQEQLPELDEIKLGIGTDNFAVADDADQACIRLSVCYHLGAALAAGEPSYEFEHDLLDDLDEIRRDVPEFATLSNEEGLSAFERLSEYCFDQGTLGFLLKVDSPVLTSNSFSWGLTNSYWAYGETFEEAWEKALTWGRKRSETACKSEETRV